MNLVEAIGKMEGYGADPNNRPTRLNNPGDIEQGKFALAHGALAVSRDPRFATFPDAATGFAALRALLLAPAYRDLTIAQAIAKYAPNTENNTALYISSVCRWAGLSPDTKVADALKDA